MMTTKCVSIRKKIRAAADCNLFPEQDVYNYCRYVARLLLFEESDLAVHAQQLIDIAYTLSLYSTYACNGECKVASA